MRGDLFAQRVRSVAYGFHLLFRHLDLAGLALLLRVGNAARDADLHEIHSVSDVLLRKRGKLRGSGRRHRESAVAVSAGRRQRGAGNQQIESRRLSFAFLYRVAHRKIGESEVPQSAKRRHAGIELLSARRSDELFQHSRTEGALHELQHEFLRSAAGKDLARRAGAEKMRMRIYQPRHGVQSDSVVHRIARCVAACRSDLYNKSVFGKNIPALHHRAVRGHVHDIAADKHDFSVFLHAALLGKPDPAFHTRLFARPRNCALAHAYTIIIQSFGSSASTKCSCAPRH